LSGRSPCYQGSPHRCLLRSVKNFQSFTVICRKPHVASSICLRATIFQNPDGTLWTHCILRPSGLIVLYCFYMCARMWTVYMLNLVSILLILFEVCWNSNVTTPIELLFCVVTLHFRYIRLLVCYFMAIWSECFSWVPYFVIETLCY
jgi:hypothetical protein